MGDVVRLWNGPPPGRRTQRRSGAGARAVHSGAMKEEPRDQRPKLRLTQLSHGAG
jgi:hypothetical protein